MPTSTVADEVLKGWGDKLRLERHRQRLTQAQVAFNGDVSQTVVFKVERGQGSLQSFLTVAAVLGVDLLAESP